MKFDSTLPDEAPNLSGTHPAREAFVLVAGIAAVGVALFVAIDLVVDLAVPRIPPRFESKIFANSWLEDAVSPASEEPADRREGLLAALLGRMARHWPENPYELRIAVFEESTPNALALPGGSILVTSGLLDQVESENELAFVLAHELGHFRNRDHLRGIGRGVAFALVLGAFGLGGSGGAGQLAAVSGGLAARGFNRDQESAADEFGLALVQAEYGHVAGTWDFFGRLPDLDGAVGKEIAHYLATHPLNEERIAALRQLASSRGWPQTGDILPLVKD